MTQKAQLLLLYMRSSSCCVCCCFVKSLSYLFCFCLFYFVCFLIVRFIHRHADVSHVLQRLRSELFGPFASAARRFIATSMYCCCFLCCFLCSLFRFCCDALLFVCLFFVCFCSSYVFPQLHARNHMMFKIRHALPNPLDPWRPFPCLECQGTTL